MYSPLVSIVIPVYNGSNFLSQAIDSALAQTYKNIEILVINDGSNDDGATEKVALSYGDKISYFNKKNGGVSSALNFGIKKMKGEWFSWLSHDDLYAPDKIEKQIKKVEENKKDRTIVLCSGSLMDMNCNSIFYPQKTINKKLDGIGLFNEFLKGYVLNGLGFLIPKIALEKINGFDETMRYLQDLDCWLRLMQQNYTFICHRDLLVKTRVHLKQYTNTHSELFNTDKENLSKKHIKELSQRNEKKANELLKLYLYLFERDNNAVGISLTKKILYERNEYSLNIAIRASLIRFKRNIIQALKKLYKIFVINKKRNNYAQNTD